MYAKQKAKNDSEERMLGQRTDASIAARKAQARSVDKMSIVDDFFSQLNPSIDTYELISSINHFFKSVMPIHHFGLSMERQYRFCSPALNLVLTYQLTSNVERSVKAYQDTKLAVCYIYACDNFYETRNDFYKQVSDELLKTLRRKLGKMNSAQLEELLKSFSRYWCFENVLREKIRNSGQVLSYSDFWGHVLLRSINAKLYALILKRACGEHWTNLHRYLHGLLYFNLVIDDLQNDLDDLNDDIYSGEPNLFSMLFLFKHSNSGLKNSAKNHIVSQCVYENEQFFTSIIALLKNFLDRWPEGLDEFSWLKRFINTKIETFGEALRNEEK